MRKWIKRTLIGLGLVVLAIAALIGVAVFNLWYENSYKSQVQNLEVPDRNIQFVLLTDIAGFGDRAWYVYQLPVGAGLTKQMQTGHDTEGVLFWNYTEAGDHSENPRIEVLKNKYLVFSRGGLYHSLYNFETKEVIVNDESPWGSYINSEQSKTPSGSLPAHEEMKKRMDAWVQKNLHSKIEKILNNAT